VTLRAMTEALADPEQAEALLRIPHLPEFWRQVAEGR
jgi:hypothetical protein